MEFNEEREASAGLRQSCAAAVLCCVAGWAQAAPFAYVVNRQDSNVAVVDLANNRVVSTIPAGMANPHEIAISPDGQRAYLSSSWSTNVTVLDLEKRRLLTDIALNYTGNGVALNPEKKLAYADTNPPGGAMIAVIDTTTNQRKHSFPVGTQKSLGLAIQPDGSRLYSLGGPDDAGAGTVAVIDPASSQVLEYVRVGTEASDMQLHPAGTFLYVVNRDSLSPRGSVSVIDTTTNTVAATIAVGRSPKAVSLHPAGTQAWVVNQGDGTLSVIDTHRQSVMASIAMANLPQRVAFNPSGTRAYASHPGSNTMSIIDTQSYRVLATVPVGSDPWGIGFAGTTDSSAARLGQPSARSSQGGPSGGLSPSAPQPIASPAEGGSRSGAAQPVPVSGVWAGLLLVVAGLGALHHHGRRLLG